VEEERIREKRAFSQWFLGETATRISSEGNGEETVRSWRKRVRSCNQAIVLLTGEGA
jgi:hypothetical protein